MCVFISIYLYLCTHTRFVGRMTIISNRTSDHIDVLSQNNDNVSLFSYVPSLIRKKNFFHFMYYSN